MISYEKKFLLIVFFSGFSLLSMEILGSRILSPVFGGTIFVWTSIITATLTYLSLGYYYGGKFADRKKITINILGILILSTGLYILLLQFFYKYILLTMLSFGTIYGPLLSSLILLSLPMVFLGMVSPSIIKFSVRSSKEIGSISGNVFASGTIGSIVGALSTGFLLIPFVGLSTSLAIIGIILILSSFLVIESRKKYLSLLALIVFLIPAQSPAAFVESFDTAYGKISVVNSHNRLLLYENRIIQTAKDLQTNETAAFYIEYFRIPFEYYNSSGKTATNSMMVGLAGGSIARDLTKTYKTEMDIIELDPKTVEVSMKYFNWNNEAEIHIDDARHFLIQNEKKYDIIIIDIGFIHPSSHLFTLEAFQLYKSRLSEKGFLIFHLDSQKSSKSSPTIKSLGKTLKKVFPKIVFISKDVIHDSPQVIAFIASSEIDEKYLYNITKYIDPSMSYQYINDSYASESFISTDNLNYAEFNEYFEWSISQNPDKIHYLLA